MQFVCSNQEAFAQAAINHDSNDFECFAAIGVAGAAGVTCPAIHVRFHTAAVAGLDASDIIGNRQYFDSQFMSGNPGIAEEWHLAEVAADISSADTHSVSSHQCLTRPWLTRIGNVDMNQLSGFLKLNGLHGCSLSHIGRAYCFDTDRPTVRLIVWQAGLSAKRIIRVTSC